MLEKYLFHASDMSPPDTADTRSACRRRGGLAAAGRGAPRLSVPLLYHFLVMNLFKLNNS